jgi:hypothetical protein
MKIEHGFFVREMDCIIDVSGLLEALNRIITVDLSCLHCFLEFKSADAVR